MCVNAMKDWRNNMTTIIPFLFITTVFKKTLQSCLTEESQKKTIRNAFQHWMDNTCVRFTELATNAQFADNHILITKEEG